MPSSVLKTLPPSSGKTVKPKAEKPSSWKIWRRRILLGLLVLLLVVAGSLYSTYQATQQKPDFYTSIVEAPTTNVGPPVEVVAEEQIQQVEAAAETGENWRFEFTQDQINQYLAEVLPEQYPNLLPPQLQKPRVKLEEGKALLACQYESPRFNAVLWLDAEAKVSEDGRTLKLIPMNAYAGLLPMPLSRLFDRLKVIDVNTGPVDIQLAEEAPQAILLSLKPDALPPDRSNYRIESIRLQPGTIVLEGSWDTESEMTGAAGEDGDVNQDEAADPAAADGAAAEGAKATDEE